MINPQEFNFTVKKLREFFCTKHDFTECHVQDRLDVLSACENPENVATFDYAGCVYPMKQTGQMNLEEIILKNPSLNSLCCVTTSYRQEPDPTPGRHDLVFPMWEIEKVGTFDELLQLEADLCTFLGFDPNVGEVDEHLRGFINGYPIIDYEQACQKYNVSFIEKEQEEQLYKDYGAVVFLINFPERTSPFFNMAIDKVTGLAKKCDVLLYGMETIGSAARETDIEIMKQKFHTISDGRYAHLLFSLFGKERVLRELDYFLSLSMIERYGFGMGMTRLIRALKLAGKI